MKQNLCLSSTGTVNTRLVFHQEEQHFKGRLEKNIVNVFPFVHYIAVAAAGTEQTCLHTVCEVG